MMLLCCCYNQSTNAVVLPARLPCPAVPAVVFAAAQRRRFSRLPSCLLGCPLPMYACVPPRPVQA